MTIAPTPTPQKGQIVRVRTRHWLVEAAQSSKHGTLVQLACVDDDAQGEIANLVWEVELDALILDGEAWQNIGKREFDRPEYFAAYLNTLRWNCVTSTDNKLFQAPFRAGIRIDPYQLEPLSKALALPRVNLFIADDVGLGKTIEAGLIANELRLRRRVNEIVVACPPSMTEQWQDELQSRFGLTFQIYNRDYVETIRRQRGYSENPWTTFPRWIISHRLLIDEDHSGPLKQWLDHFKPGTLLILDEAHHAAPATSQRYAIDSYFTKAIRDLAPRFEHRLFLSATPHNGHSNSFSALLEILDSNRFTRGVPVLKKNLNAVMVRRLKEDIRASGIAPFPIRETIAVEIKGLPNNAPELQLAELLAQYSQTRKLRFKGCTKRQEATGTLILCTLQQRLFSSLEAFHRTLDAHRRAMERVWVGEAANKNTPLPTAIQLSAGFGNDDDGAELPADEQEREAAAAIAAVTQRGIGNTANANPQLERELLDRMANIANSNRCLPDARVKHLLAWLHDNLCPGISPDNLQPPRPKTPWTNLRVIIFTEYEDTARYLRTQIETAIGDLSIANQRLAIFHGPSSPEDRIAIKQAFNEDPKTNPLRILLATDAAREGLNLQAHCWNLFHMDLPWNPSRLEQRNGRIDRKLQPNSHVYCRYFVYLQRPEDRVLAAIVRKTETIRRELGCLADVIDVHLAAGIDRQTICTTTAAIEKANESAEKRATREQELEEERENRVADLKKQTETMRNRIAEAKAHINLKEDQFRAAISCALEIDGAKPLAKSTTPENEPQRYTFPNLLLLHSGSHAWAETLDTLRAPAEKGENVFQWRNRAPLRPIVFEALNGLDDQVVQVHLSHRVAQRLLGRFVTQGFIYNDLSRACLAQTEDAIPRVVLIGRLSIYGEHATRLHEEMLLVTSRWYEPSTTRKNLTPYGRDAERRTLDLLEHAMTPGAHLKVPKKRAEQLHDAIPQDIADLLPHLQTRGEIALLEAQTALANRGDIEAKNLKNILTDQKQRVETQFAKQLREAEQLTLFSAEELKQLRADQRTWETWLKQVANDIINEPDRIRRFYQTESHRIEPIGIAYLWPITG